MMWRIAPEPVLCFDGDAAGIKAAQRGIDLALPLLEPGQSLKFALLPGGQDPDDLIRAQGAGAMQTVLDEAVTLSEMLWRREVENADLATPERRAGAERSLMTHIDTIVDLKVREHYRTAMRERLKALFAPAEPQRQGGTSGRREPWSANRFQARAPFKPERPGARPLWTPPVSEAVRRSAAGRGGAQARSASEPSAAALILTALNHPYLLEAHAEALANIPIPEANLDKIRLELLHAASLGHSLDSQGLRDHLRHRGLGDVCERLERRPMLKSMAMTRRDTAQAVVLREFQHALARHRKLTELEAEHAQAAEALRREMTDENLARLRAITDELQSTIGAEAGPPDAF
jgi:DNA primase